MIKVESLTKRYRDLVAVNDVSFEVETGQILGFLGPNGAGKTTTMRMITGYLSPTSGRVMVDNLDVFEYPIEVKSQIGYLPETPPLYLDMTARSYLRHVAELKGVEYKAISKEIERVAERTGITHVMGRLLANLSKGYRQRVGLSQALLGNPRVLILDEPSSGLDPAQIREIRDTIRDLAQEHTVILSTHILPEVTMLCDRVIIINRGTIVTDNSMNELTGQGRNSDLLELRIQEKHEDVKKLLEKIEGVEEVEASEDELEFDIFLDEEDPEMTAKVLDTLVEKGVKVYSLQPVVPTLEDIFLQAIHEYDDDDQDAYEEEDAFEAKASHESDKAKEEAGEDSKDAKNAEEDSKK
ncbi:MAG: ABC transporter ATP-binding protein [Myxococcota bacterium]